MADSVNRAAVKRKDTGRLTEAQMAPQPPPRKWRIAVAAPALDFNGVTLYAVMLVKALQAQGHEILVIAPTGPLKRELPTEGITFSKFDGGNPGFFAWRALKAEVAEFAPDVLHAVVLDSGIAIKLAHALEIPLCVTVHGTGPGELPAPGDLKFDAYLAMDQAVRENLINACRVPREMNTLIPTAAFALHAPDERHVLDPRTRPVVGCLGPLLPNTGHHAYVEAAFSLCARQADLMFTILGTGPVRAEIRQMIEDRGLLQRIVMVESLYDYSLAWQPFDIVYVDSRQPAATSMALAAMSNGLPVVGSEGGVLFDVIEDGVDGVLVARDNGQALADKLLTLVQQPAERLRLGKSAFADVETMHTPAAMVAALSEAYAAMVAGEPLPKASDGTSIRRAARAQA
ncbi:MAG: glycosyltransferase family 4 protein [Planctomycetes bacterium]|nr:glycosyltransferase family 4 protein [Planctomycetota bacterium]